MGTYLEWHPKYEPSYAEPHVRWCERSENESRKKTTSFSSYSIFNILQSKEAAPILTQPPYFCFAGRLLKRRRRLLHHAVVIRHDVGPFSRHKHTLVLFPCHVQYLQHTLCRRVKQITVLIFPQYQAHLFSP